jgi:hypothetical protein
LTFLTSASARETIHVKDTYLRRLLAYQTEGNSLGAAAGPNQNDSLAPNINTLLLKVPRKSRLVRIKAIQQSVLTDTNGVNGTYGSHTKDLLPVRYLTAASLWGTVTITP